MTQTVYVKLSQITQVHKKDVFLSDIADAVSYTHLTLPTIA